MIPDLAVRGVLQRWRRIEEAKRRMIRGAIKLGLPLETKAERGDGLAFDSCTMPPPRTAMSHSFSPAMPGVSSR